MIFKPLIWMDYEARHCETGDVVRGRLFATTMERMELARREVHHELCEAGYMDFTGTPRQVVPTVSRRAAGIPEGVT